MAGDDRDPTACCLYYFALGKSKLVHGLWKQAAWHKEQNVMLKFLSNDFTQARWRTAALKNAFALLSKQRYGVPLTILKYLKTWITDLHTFRIRYGILPFGK
jgi:hypothetical protein